MIQYHNGISNGGFAEYFYNRKALFAYLALENLKRIHALQHAEVLEKALEMVNPGQYPAEEFRNIIFNRPAPEYFDNKDEFHDLHLQLIDCLIAIWTGCSRSI